MPARIQTNGGVTVASLAGEIDHHSAAPMRAAIDAACTDNASQTLILDFGGVTFMDSSGIGLVMGRFKLMQTLGGELILSNLPSPIRKVMRMAGLDRLAVIDRKPERQVVSEQTTASPQGSEAPSSGGEPSIQEASAPLNVYSFPTETSARDRKEEAYEEHK